MELGWALVREQRLVQGLVQGSAWVSARGSEPVWASVSALALGPVWALAWVLAWVLASEPR